MKRFVLFLLTCFALTACLSEAPSASRPMPAAAKGLDGDLETDDQGRAIIDGEAVEWTVDDLCHHEKVCCYDCDGDGVEGCDYRTSWYYLPLEDVEHVDDLKARQWACMPSHEHQREHGGEIETYFPDGPGSCIEHRHLRSYRRYHFAIHPTEDCT